jgi:hypothetical protein
MTCDEALRIVEVFVKRCHERAMRDPMPVRAYERAVGMELELLRQEVRAKHAAPEPPQPMQGS